MNIVHCNPIEWLRTYFKWRNEFGNHYVKIRDVEDGIQAIHCEDVLFMSFRDTDRLARMINANSNKIESLLPSSYLRFDYDLKAKLLKRLSYLSDRGHPRVFKLLDMLENMYQSHKD